MALVVENGTGLSTAESYASVAFADAYFAAKDLLLRQLAGEGSRCLMRFEKHSRASQFTTKPPSGGFYKDTMKQLTTLGWLNEEHIKRIKYYDQTQITRIFNSVKAGCYSISADDYQCQMVGLNIGFTRRLN